MLKHKIRIWVSPKDDEQTQVLKSGQRTVRSRLMDCLFGKEVGVLILTPGRTVETVEIQELSRKEVKHDTKQSTITCE